jgi:heme/copper-type cytochrome/quinol oxidase subunit 3
MHGTPVVAQVALWARCYNQAHGPLFTVSYTVYMILYIHVLLVVWFPVALILAPSNTCTSAAWADADQSMNFGDRRDRLAIRVARS